MTHEEFKDRLAAIHADIYLLNKAKKELQDEYIASLPYKVGDKVKVAAYKDPAGIVCFVGKIRFSDFGFDVQFNKVKADGTMSGQSAAIYGFDSIEVIEPAAVQ